MILTNLIGIKFNKTQDDIYKERRNLLDNNDPNGEYFSISPEKMKCNLNK